MEEISIVCMEKDGRYLMMRRSSTDASYPLWWSFPGGHVDPSETPEQAGCREVREESGLRVSPECLSFIVRMQKNGKMLFFYFADVFQGRVKLGDGEHDRYCWIAPYEVDCYKTFNSCKIIIDMIENGGKKLLVSPCN